MSNHEADGAAITAYSSAMARHKAAMSRLTEIGRMVQCIQNGKRAAENWEISDSADLRERGGIRCTSEGAAPVTRGMWPSFDQVVETIRERDTSKMERDMALEHLKKLGIDPEGWK